MFVEVESCSPAEARTEHRRILSSKHFNTSERNRRFLEYVVEEILAENLERGLQLTRPLQSSDVTTK